VRTKGNKADSHRIVACKAQGISMRPTINDGSIVWIEWIDLQPKVGEVYAFFLKDSNSVTIKRLIKVNSPHIIINSDNNNTEDRKTEEPKDYPMALNAVEYSSEQISSVVSQVIWVLNRMIEKPEKGTKKSKKK
jgi:phage repressor protein C with HTH and peptisase S24 domain